MRLQDSGESSWGKRLVVGALGLAIGTLALCDGPEKPNKSETTEVEGLREKNGSAVKRIPLASSNPKMEESEVDHYSIRMPLTQEGLVDLDGTSLVVLNQCVEGFGDAVCTSPDPRVSKCVSTRAGGAVPVIIKDPFYFDDEGRSSPNSTLVVRVGGSEVLFPVDENDLELTNEALTSACKEVRRWLNTSLESLDRNVVCKGVAPDSKECNDYMDRLNAKSSEGSKLERQYDELIDMLDPKGVSYFQDKPSSSISLDLFNKDGEKKGNLRVEVKEKGGVSFYSILGEYELTDGGVLVDFETRNLEDAVLEIEDRIAAATSQ